MERSKVIKHFESMVEEIGEKTPDKFDARMFEDDKSDPKYKPSNN